MTRDMMKLLFGLAVFTSAWQCGMGGAWVDSLLEHRRTSLVRVVGRVAGALTPSRARTASVVVLTVDRIADHETAAAAAA